MNFNIDNRSLIIFLLLSTPAFLFATPQDSDLLRIKDTVSFLGQHGVFSCGLPETLVTDFGTLQMADMAEAIHNDESERVRALLELFNLQYSDMEKSHFLEEAVSKSPLGMRSDVPYLLLCYGANVQDFHDPHVAEFLNEYLTLDARRTTLQFELDHVPAFHSKYGEAFYAVRIGGATVFLNSSDATHPRQLAKIQEQFLALSDASNDAMVFYKIVRPSQMGAIRREGLEPRYGGQNGASSTSSSFGYLVSLDAGKMFVGTTPLECLFYFDLLSENNKVYLLRLSFPLQLFTDYQMSYGGGSGGWYFQGMALSTESIEYALVDGSDLASGFEFHSLQAAVAFQ